MIKQLIIFLLLLFAFLLFSQEVSSQLIVEEKFTLNLAEKLVQDGGRLYFYLSGARAWFRDVDLGCDLSFIQEDEMAVDILRLDKLLL